MSFVSARITVMILSFVFGLNITHSPALPAPRHKPARGKGADFDLDQAAGHLPNLSERKRVVDRPGNATRFPPARARPIA